MNKSMIYLSLKLFLKGYSTIISFLVLLIFCSISTFTNLNFITNNSGNTMSFLQSQEALSLPVFIFLLFIAFEYFRKAKSIYLEETLLSLGSNGIQVMLSQIVIMIFVGIVVFIELFLISIFTIQPNFTDGFIKNIILMNILNFGIMGLCAIAFGLIISKVKNRFIGYALLAILSIFASTALNDVITQIYNTIHLPVFLIKDILDVSPPDIMAATDALYGFPVESYQWALKFIWILCAGIIMTCIWMRANKKNRNIVCGILVIVLFVNGIIFYDRGDTLQQEDSPFSALTAISRYYLNHTNDNIPANFNITSYNMKFTIKKNLTATVTMKLPSNETQSAYDFTLYHSYKISSVKNQNNIPLGYEQNGDYFKVINIKNLPISEITVNYHGSNELFYANTYAAFLPGFFAYYPRAGLNPMYSNDLMDGAGSGFEAMPDDQLKKFTVSISSPLKIYSNLDGNLNKFSGNADNLLLMAGFVKCSKINTHTLFTLPLMLHSQQSLTPFTTKSFNDSFIQTKKNLGETRNIRVENMKIIEMPSSLAFNSLCKKIYMSNDYLLIRNTNETKINFLILDQITPTTEAKKELKDSFFEFADNPDVVSQLPTFAMMYSQSNYSHTKESKDALVYDSLIIKAKEIGFNNMVKPIYQYLNDPTNTTDELTFVQNLK